VSWCLFVLLCPVLLYIEIGLSNRCLIADEARTIEDWLTIIGSNVVDGMMGCDVHIN